MANNSAGDLVVKLPRRTLLKGTGAVALAGGAGAVALNSMDADSGFEFRDWDALRDEFEQDFSWSNFAGFLLASPPRSIEADIELHRKALNRNAPRHISKVYRLERQAREWAGQYFGVEPSQVSITGNTTMGLATLYNGIRIRPDQEFLVTEHEHRSCRSSIQFRGQREGIPVNTIRLYDSPRSATDDEVLSRIEAAVTDKTRVLALSWVHSGSSFKLPAAKVSALVKQLNANRDPEDAILFGLDGVHGFGVENATFDELGCDYFVAGTHKWMFGPSGTGVMISRSDKLDHISPTIPPFIYSGERSFGSIMTPGGYHSFEHRAAQWRAFQFHLAIGKERVQKRIHGLNDYLKVRLEDMPHVQLITPLGNQYSSGFTFFRVPGVKPNVVRKAMRKEQILVSPANRDIGPVVRMAPGLLNNEAEIDAALEVLSTLA